MYILVVTKDNTIYSYHNKVYATKYIAKAALKRLNKDGNTLLEVYKVKDLDKVIFED